MHTTQPVALWWGQEADCPVVAVAVHAGHGLRQEVADLTAVPASRRCQEEDFGTAGWAMQFPTRLVAGRSRFEVDLNRPRDSAVYLRPEDCWDLQPWRRPLPAEVAERSRQVHDAFYGVLAGMLDRAQNAFGRFVVYDLHSYNHRRGDPAGSPADPAANPDVNVGTGTLDRARWGHVVDAFCDAIVGYDVRENVRFRGGYLSQWVHETFPDTGCALAIEVKKIFMDERTGELDETAHADIGRALTATVEPVLRELAAVRR
jgi:N-formylglutamate amidohydrolase